MRGLLRGEVVQTANDPEGEFRVRIMVPTLHDGEPRWARLAQMQASYGSGTMFFPEIGDEVVIGFLDDDPETPVVLGSLFSRARAPNSPPNETNDIKALVSRSRLQIQFDDREEVLTISTLRGQVVELSDSKHQIILRDESGSSVEMTREGIKIHSEGDLAITASGALTIGCGNGVSVKAGADLALSGLDISVEAASTLHLVGAAETTVKASGELTIEGALVRIN
jgi:uncharacterized protein involved in type VI secretion and phage assembly